MLWSDWALIAGTRLLAFFSQILPTGLPNRWRNIFRGKLRKIGHVWECVWVSKWIKSLSRILQQGCEVSSTSCNPLVTSTTSNILPLLTPLEQPPRPRAPPPPSSATSARHLAGYNPARGDFASPPDPGLELLLTNLVAPESDLEERLQNTMVKAYNQGLKQRLRKLSLVSSCKEIMPCINQFDQHFRWRNMVCWQGDHVSHLPGIGFQPCTVHWILLISCRCRSNLHALG